MFFHEPTAHTPGGEGFWVLTRHGDILRAAASAELSSHCGGLRRDGGTLIEDLPSGFAAGVLLNMMDDPHHQEIRRLALPSVTPKALARFQPELARRARAIVDAAVDKGQCDFLLDVAAELPLQAIAELMGIPQDDRHRLFAWAEATLDYGDRELGESSPATIEANAAMFEYGQRLLDERRAAPEPGDDILSPVVRNDIATEPEQQMFFNLLIAAGTETTRNSIAVGAMALVEHPDQWRALRDDRSLLGTATEEILRWASSTAYNRRTATTDVDIGGHHVCAGDKVTLWWASANRDDDAFADPFRFDVRRDPNPHLAFGHGTHFCLGANLARLEIRLVLDALLDRVDHLELAGAPEWTRSNKHTGLRHLPMALVPISR